MGPRPMADEQSPRDEVRTTFADRHIGVSEPEQAAMLAELGYDSLDALVDAAVPASIREDAPLALDPGVSETDALLRLRVLGVAQRGVHLAHRARLLTTRSRRP